VGVTGAVPSGQRKAAVGNKALSAVAVAQGAEGGGGERRSQRRFAILADRVDSGRGGGTVSNTQSGPLLENTGQPVINGLCVLIFAVDLKVVLKGARPIDDRYVDLGLGGRAGGGGTKGTLYRWKRGKWGHVGRGLRRWCDGRRKRVHGGIATPGTKGESVAVHGMGFPNRGDNGGGGVGKSLVHKARKLQLSHARRAQKLKKPVGDGARKLVAAAEGAA